MAKDELRQEWEARIADYRASGLSVAAWCSTHGCTPRQVYYWLDKLRADEAKAAGPSQWLSVEVGEPQQPAGALRVRVGQATVEVAPGFDPALLADVVRALATLC